MKILFAQDALVNAGAERSHLEILSRFSKDVDVAFVYFYPKYELKEAYNRAGIRLFFLDIPEPYHFLTAISSLVRLIRKEKPDLLVSSLWRADIITRLASFITGVPLIGTLVNDSYSPIAWTDKKGLKYKLVYWLDLMTAGIPIHWIANAQALADSHVRTLGLSPDKISVVYRGRPIPGIAGNVIASEARAKQSSSEETVSATECAENKPNTPQSSLAPVPIISGVTRNSPRSVSPQTETNYSQRSVPASPLVGSPQIGTAIKHFISYGRLLERKGFQDAIRAFSQVIKTYPDSTLTIFGEGPYRVELERLIQDLGISHAVFLPGKIENPVEALIKGYYPLPTANCQLTTINCPLFTAHCFLFTSWYEGFSGALVEAMMAGIPIIASDIPMNLEAISKENSLIFESQNRKQLADQMIFAIEHPDVMANLGARARKVAIARFDIEKIAKTYESTLNDILELRMVK